MSYTISALASRLVGGRDQDQATFGRGFAAKYEIVHFVAYDAETSQAIRTRSDRYSSEEAPSVKTVKLQA
jgi:hypothetical protein